MARPAANDRRRPCPRCDYDLSGEVDSWKDECPLEGICPECGLKLEWRNVLNPRLAVPKWSFEHAESRTGALIRTRFSTVLMTIRPWRFWRELRLELPINVARLIEFAFLAPLLLYVLLVAANGWNYFYMQAHGYEFARFQARIYVFDQRRVPEWHEHIRHLLLPADDQCILVSHPAPWSWVALAVLWALLMPCSFLALYQTRRLCKVRAAHLWRIMVYSIAPFATLLVLQVLIVALHAPASPTNWYWRTGGWLLSVTEILQRPGVIFFATLTILLAWWYSASRLYLRLPHAGTVTLCMALIGLMGSVALVAYLDGNRFLLDVARMFLDSQGP